jgi:hypothetical protein
MHRKGQNASGAAVLVAAIAAILIAYILFLPPAERDALLGNTPSTGGTGGTGGTGSMYEPVTLLQENIGTITLARTNSVEHSIPSVKVTTQVNAGEIKRVESLAIKRGTFEESTKDIKFSIDMGTTQYLILSFNIRSAKGMLTITLNGEDILNSELQPGSAQPIRLDSQVLQKDNVLTFKVSSPGGAFWNVNEYKLENIVISGELTDYSRTGAEQHFSITENEFSTLEKAELKYTPGCQAASTLIVRLNNNPVFSGLPKCNTINTIEIGKNLLKQDDNSVIFEAPAGTYDVTSIKLKTYLEKPVNQVYYFTITPELYYLLDRREMQGFVFITFPEEGTNHQGTLTLNSHKAAFKTQDAEAIFRISSYLKEGTNSISILPSTDSLDITELAVELR